MSNWTDRWLWPRKALSDIAADVIAIRMTTENNTLTLRNLKKEIQIMADREDASFEKLTADLTAVAAGWGVLTASNAQLVDENAQLRAALESADADKAAAIASALDTDSEADADKVDAADAIIAGLVPPADQPPADEPPADGEG